jgi:SAM-dependent methyltransferase
MHVKRFYQDYLADNSISPLSEELLLLIKQERPNSVLEFGCGTAKHLKALPNVPKKLGIDLSLHNLIHANVKNDQNYLALGDEDLLTRLFNFDIVFTCSVLDHIEKIDDIIAEMKRIVNKAIFIAETLDTPGPYYYPHEYEKHGFQKTGFKWVSEKGDGAVYHIWTWRK